MEFKICGIKNNTNIKIKLKFKEEKERLIEELNYKVKKMSKQFKEEMKETTHAYEEIQSEGLRKIYNDELLKKDKERELIGETAYDFFNISEKELKLCPDNKNDLLIKNKFEKRMENYLSALQNNNLGFRKRQEIETLVLKAKKYYKLIENSKKRKLYEEYLDDEEKSIENKIREKIIEEKYSKKDQYDKNLIKTIEEGRLLGEKMVLKKEANNSETIFLQDDRDMKLEKTAEILFRNATRVYNSYVNEYKLTRTFEGKEKVDTIYTNLSLPELAINKNTGKPVNSEYYNCVVNELLSEDAIEGSKYNGGYIGMVERNNYGDYEATLKNKKLNPSEQENLAAVMIIKEKKEKEKKNKREEECK